MILGEGDIIHNAKLREIEYILVKFEQFKHETSEMDTTF